MTKRTAGARAKKVGRLETAIGTWRHRRAFDGVHAYCMFIGHPRSGHSLVGSLLDAHHGILIANELDALKFVQEQGATRDRLFWLILRTDRDSAAARTSGKYDYTIPGQWQGRFDRLQVVGDKMGGTSSVRLDEDPGLLDRLTRTVGVDVRIVHVVRNPYDNISTMSKAARQTLEQAVERYFTMCAANDAIRRRDDTTVLDVRHEDLIADPRGTLSGLCGFLGVDAPEDYLAACGSIVFSSPHRSRNETRWPPDLIDEVQRRMEPFDYLQGYTFHEDDELAPIERTEP